jgi:hypothetical protein
VAELVSFDGVEIYLKEWPELNGLQFNEVLFAFEGAVPIGLADSTRCHINPPADRVIRAGESVVVIAVDDSTYRLRSDSERRDTRRAIRRDTLPPPRSYKQRLSTLFVNWHPGMRSLLADYDELVAPGSNVTLLSRMSTAEMKTSLAGGGAGSLVLNQIAVKFQSDDVTDLVALQTLPLEE